MVVAVEGEHGGEDLRLYELYPISNGFGVWGNVLIDGCMGYL